jgi:hypothetical protein
MVALDDNMDDDESPEILMSTVEVLVAVVLPS